MGFVEVIEGAYDFEPASFILFVNDYVFIGGISSERDEGSDSVIVKCFFFFFFVFF